MHARVYQTMVTTWERGSVITPLTLHAAMKADPGLVEVGGHAYLAGFRRRRRHFPMSAIVRGFFTISPCGVR